MAVKGNGVHMCERVCVCVCLWSGGGASVVGENESGENQVNFKSLRTYSGHTEKDCDVIYLINKISLFFCSSQGLYNCPCFRLLLPLYPCYFDFNVPESSAAAAKERQK